MTTTVSFAHGFFPLDLTHVEALAQRLPDVPLSACEGELVFRRFARPGFANTPRIFRCAACGDVLALEVQQDRVLWVERMANPPASGDAS